MDRTSQPARTGLINRLTPQISRINFYRFCQYLEQATPHAPPLGSTANPADDAVRFRPHPGMGFPVSELKAVEYAAQQPDAPLTVRTTFLGFTASIPLCRRLTWTTLRREKTAMRR
jgi:type VI secretion system protein ImpH